MATSQDYARRISGLLVKAESTTNPHEAEAFFAKAQELMTRYAVSEAQLEGARQTEDNPIETRDVFCVAPYSMARTKLLHQVAMNNGCRAVILPSGNAKTVQLVGYRRDLERTELLYASLSTHAAGEMLKQNVGNEQAFRRGFLVAFAERIGERLAEARAAALADSGGLLPVLVDRSGLVEDFYRNLYPYLRKTRVGRGSAAGRGAGTSAANLADLGQTRVGSRRMIR